MSSSSSSSNIAPLLYSSTTTTTSSSPLSPHKLLNKKKPKWELNKLGVLFLLLALIQALAVIGGTIANMVLNSMQPNPSYSSYFLSSVLIVIMISMTYFAFDSVLFENSFELLGFTVASLVMFIRLIYGIVNVLTETNNHKTMATTTTATNKLPRSHVSVLVTSSIVLFIQLTQFLLLIPLQKSFGWRSYRLIGTDDSLIRRYRIYNFFLACIKIDTLLSVLVLMMGLFFVEFDYWLSYVGVGAGMAVSLLSIPLLIVGVRFEKVVIVVLWCVWAPALPGYLIYKVIVFWIHKGHIHQWNGSTLNDTDLVIVLTILSICTIMMRVLLWIVTVIATLNFGYGLKDIHKRAKDKVEKVNDSQGWHIGPNGEIIFDGDNSE